MFFFFKKNSSSLMGYHFSLPGAVARSSDVVRRAPTTSPETGALSVARHAAGEALHAAGGNPEDFYWM